MASRPSTFEVSIKAILDFIGIPCRTVFFKRRAAGSGHTSWQTHHQSKHQLRYGRSSKPSTPSHTRRTRSKSCVMWRWNCSRPASGSKMGPKTRTTWNARCRSSLATDIELRLGGGPGATWGRHFQTTGGMMADPSPEQIAAACARIRAKKRADITEFIARWQQSGQTFPQ